MEGQEKSNVQRTSQFTPSSHPFTTANSQQHIHVIYTHKSMPLHRQRQTSQKTWFHYHHNVLGCSFSVENKQKKHTPHTHRTFPSGSWRELSQVCVACPAALLLVHQSYGNGFQCKNMPASIIPQMVVSWCTMLSVTAFLGACEIIAKKSLQSLELRSTGCIAPQQCCHTVL